MKLSKLFIFIFLLPLTISCSEKADPVANPDLGEVSYKVTFTSTWSENTHPNHFPSNAHFSGVIGATHNINESLWTVGELSSEGVEQVAETGSKNKLEDEINDKIALGDVDRLISESGLSSSPAELSFTVILRPEYTYISLLSMLAPSPDWIVGVDALNLMPEGVWKENETIDLYVYDAGTDDGAEFTSTDIDSNPKQAIERIETTPFLIDNVVTPIGTFRFEKQ